MIYLLLQTLFWIALAVFFGILIGWLVWGRRISTLNRDYQAIKQTLEQREKNETDITVLQQSLSDIKQANSKLESQLEQLEKDNNELNKNLGLCNNKNSDYENELEKISAENRRLIESIDAQKKSDAASSLAIDTSEIRSSSNVNKNNNADNNQQFAFLGDIDDGADDNTSVDDDIDISDDFKPVTLSEPNEGQADDLTKIKGIGPKINDTLHGLGIYHFQQIADFTRENVLWVDNYLSFKGRIDREDWIGQAKILAQGGETEFSQRQS